MEKQKYVTHIDDKEFKTKIETKDYEFLRGNKYKYVIDICNKENEDLYNVILNEDLPLAITIHKKEIKVQDITKKDKSDILIPLQIVNNYVKIHLKKVDNNQKIRITIPFTINY